MIPGQVIWDDSSTNLWQGLDTHPFELGPTTITKVKEIYQKPEPHIFVVDSSQVSSFRLLRVFHANYKVKPPQV